MKNLSKFSLLFVFLSFFISSSVLAATSTSSLNTDGAQSQKAILLATVNIQNAKIESQNNNEFNISFYISNRVGTQTGVKYGVKLVNKDNLVIDENVYEESLTLNPNTTLTKNIVYTAPSSLGGSYNLIVTSSNSSGFKFSNYDLGQITLKGSSVGLLIKPESCSLQSLNGNTKYTLEKGIAIKGGESIELTCSVLNSTKTSVTVSPSYETRLNSLYGEIVKTDGGDNKPIILKALEEKSFSVILPGVTSPQKYNVSVNLSNKDLKSNNIFVNYTLLGLQATLENINLDKDFYKKGDMAQVSFFFTSSDGSVWTDNSLIKDYNINSKLEITNSSGASCIDPYSNVITKANYPQKIDNSIKIIKTCFDPKVKITLTDESGKILDQKEWQVKTTSEVPSSSNSITIIIVVALLVIIGIIYIYIKRKNTPPTTPTDGKPIEPINQNIPIGMILFFLLVAIFGFIPSGKVSADNFYYAQGFLDLSIGNFDGTVYDPFTTGMTISAKASYSYVGPGAQSGFIIGAKNGMSYGSGVSISNDKTILSRIKNFLIPSAQATLNGGPGSASTGYLPDNTYTKIFSVNSFGNCTTTTGASCTATSTQSVSFPVQSTSGSYNMIFADNGSLSSNPASIIPYLVLNPPTPYVPPTVTVYVNGSTAPISLSRDITLNTGVTVSWVSDHATSCSCTSSAPYIYGNQQTSTNCGSGIGTDVLGKNPAGINNFKFSDTITFSVICNDNGSSGSRSSATPTAYYPSCFVANTLVTLADGSKKNIQDVKVGDVLKGEKTNNIVLGLHRPELTGPLYSFNGGRYFVTAEHPFKTTDGWKSINPKLTADENIGITVTPLKVGDTLVTDHGNVKLLSIDGKVGKKDTGLYNFFLDGDHTYYADGYLVHNKAICNNTLGVYCNPNDHSTPACINGTGLRTTSDGTCGVVYPSGGCATGYTPTNDGGTTACNPN